MTNEEHIARATLLGMVFDSYTKTYRFLSPGGDKYKYIGAIWAETMVPCQTGEVLAAEKEYGIRSNIPSRKRMGYE